MKIVFLCGPYRAKTVLGRILNIYRARKVAIQFWKKGYAVICPHLNSALFDKYCREEIFLDGYLEIVRRSDILALLPDWSTSSGARKEHKLAIKLKKKVVHA